MVRLGDDIDEIGGGGGARQTNCLFVGRPSQNRSICSGVRIWPLSGGAQVSLEYCRKDIPETKMSTKSRKQERELI